VDEVDHCIIHLGGSSAIRGLVTNLLDACPTRITHTEPMTEELLARLKEIDLAILTEVVRKDQQSPSFEIAEWSVTRLSGGGIANPDGLWLFSGKGWDSAGSRRWAVVLKILERQEQETPLSDLWHWKREVLLAQSGMIERLPGPVRAPQFYRVDETADGAWLWMEHVESHRSSPWVLDDYVFAAYQLGYWNGACITGMPLPTEAWLARQHYRSWLSYVNHERDWPFPLHQKYISDDTRNRIERLWAEREMFFSILEDLPQVFSHFDSQRRNLFIRRDKDEQEELVIVDWAFCGLGPLGAELSGLVSTTAMLLDWPSSALPELEAAAFGSYVQGLRKAGWSGDANFVRLAYLTWHSVWRGCAFVPSFTAWWCTGENRPAALRAFGLAEEELYLQWLPLLDHSLDCADEVRLLMG
jgi:hypothetical protein